MTFQVNWPFNYVKPVKMLFMNDLNVMIFHLWNISVGYLETVSKVVKAIDRNCYDTVYAAFNCMESLIHGSTCRAYTNTSQIPSALK
jgi:hypothetical protein